MPNAEKDAGVTPLTMEQIEAMVEEVIDANNFWFDPLPSQVSAVMDIVREAMAQAFDQALAQVTSGVESAQHAHHERGHRQIVAAFAGLRTAIPSTENPYRAGEEAIDA